MSNYPLPSRPFAGHLCSQYISKGLLVAFLGFLISGPISGQVPNPGRSDLRAVEPRCEYLKNPQGVDAKLPRLSWRLESTRPEARSQRQTAYQLIVASSEAALAENKGDLWDSGKVTSDETLHVAYAGKKLISGQACWWKVRAWDGSGNDCGWSDPAYWSMGLLQAEDWKAKWIGLDEPKSDSRFVGGSWIWHPEGNAAAGVPGETRYFRRTLTLPTDRKLRVATVNVLADNQFALWVNGKKAGEGAAYPEKVEIDITGLLQPGANTLAIQATNDAEPAPANPAGLIAEVRCNFLEGEPLIVTTNADWKVEKTAFPSWETATFDDQSWSPARMLGAFGMGPWGAGGSVHSRLPARMLRREFAPKQPVVRATAYVCGLGLFEFYLNGQKVGDHVMDPVQSCWPKRAHYVTFDVTKQIKDGSNALGVMLGNGRFFGPRDGDRTYGQTFGFPKLLFQMRLDYADGSQEIIASDEQWKITDKGPIRSNNEFDGEEYDARLEIDGWATAGFDAGSWQPVQLVSPPNLAEWQAVIGGKELPAGQTGTALVAQMVEPMRVTEVLPPVGITEPKPGVFLLDFGQNLYGAVRMKVRGSAGTRVQVRTSFSKKPDGMIKMEDNRDAKSTDIYTLRGAGEETWSPRFRGQGTRYAEVTGYPGVPTVKDFDLLVIHTDMEKVGEFSCSNELLNKISANVVRSTRMQQRGVPLDPDRNERQAWLGHPAKTSESEAYSYLVAPFYKSFMGDIRSDQRADGMISDAGSNWGFYSGDAVWPSVITVLPDWFFNFYGDRRILEENYDTMRRWMAMQQKLKLLEDFTFPPSMYGDWVDAASMDGRATDSGSTDAGLMSTAYFYNNCRILARIAERLGRADQQAEYAALAEKVRAGFLARYYEPATRKFKSETQTSYILPLAFGLVPPEDRAAIIANLVDDIMVKHKGHLSVGLIGMQWFMQVLTDAGHPEVAYHVATRTTRPGWGYMVSHGGTSMWERWDQDTRDPGMNGESQMILAGNLGAWFYQTLGGINVDPEQPAFKQVILRPQPVGDLQWVKCSFKSMHGVIRSDWQLKNGDFHWQVTIPPNTTARVHFPFGKKAVIHEGDVPVQSAPGVSLMEALDDTVVFEVKSGSYEFHVSNPK